MDQKVITFIPGHCYVNMKDSSDSPDVMVCKKSIVYGYQLVPYSGLIKLPISCDSEEVKAGSWVDCTEQVKRSEAMQACDACPLVNISTEHVGTVIAFQEDGKMSDPHFLYAYSNGMAYVMSLDGKDKVFNIKITQCYPLQSVYKDIAERAVSSDPLRSSMFDSFLRWLGKTPQYGRFVSMVEQQIPEDREDMIKLFEIMSLFGVTADNFEATVREEYEKLPVAWKKSCPNMYAGVLPFYSDKVGRYTKVEWEIMRATGGKYRNPHEAWAVVGGGKPYPKTLSEVSIESTSPHQYICDAIGLYDGNSTGFWYGVLCPATGEFPDMETEYKEAVDRYLSVCPEFDISNLDFIKEGDKEEVFKEILKVSSLDKEDPFRAWVKNPPQEFRDYRKSHGSMSYVEIFREFYERRRT